MDKKQIKELKSAYVDILSMCEKYKGIAETHANEIRKERGWERWKYSR